METLRTIRNNLADGLKVYFDYVKSHKQRTIYPLIGLAVLGVITWGAVNYFGREGKPTVITPTPTLTSITQPYVTPTPAPISKDNPIPYDKNLVVYQLLAADKVVDRTGHEPKFREGNIIVLAYLPKQNAYAVIRLGDREERYSCNRGPPNFLIPTEGGSTEVGPVGRSFSTSFNDEFARQCAQILYQIEIPVLPFSGQEKGAERTMDELVNSLGDLDRGASVIKLIPKEVKERNYPRVYKGRSTRVIGKVVQVASDGVTILVDYDAVGGVKGDSADVIVQPERRHITIGPVAPSTPDPSAEKGVPYPSD